MKNFIKDVFSFTKIPELECKYQRIFSLIDGSTTYVDEDKCVNMAYFCDDEGIKYGNEHFSQIIVPRHVFVEALNKYKNQ